VDKAQIPVCHPPSSGGIPAPRDGGSFTLQGKESALKIHLLNPISRFAVNDWDWHDLPVHTLSWRDSYDHVHSVHAVLMSLRDEPFSHRHTPDRFELTLGDSLYCIDLAEATLETRRSS
jgi:hypothetical protein